MSDLYIGNEKRVCVKILHIIDYFAPKLGYQETYLAKEQVKLGHEVIVLSSSLHFPFPHYNETVKKLIGERILKAGESIEEGIRVMRLPVKFEFCTRVWMASLVQTIQTIQPDVIHVHSVSSITSIRLSIAKFGALRNIPILADDHSHKSIVENHWSKSLFYFIYKHLFGWFVSRSLDAFVAITPETKDIVRHVMGIQKQVEVIPLGADTLQFSFSSRLRSKIRKKLGFTSKHVVFVYAGKVIQDKGIDTLIQAFVQLNDANARLLIIGNGPKEFVDELHSVLKMHKVEKNVIWMPLLPPTLLSQYYCGSDVGVWPKQESVSMVEAMSCGIPVLVKKSKSMNIRLHGDAGLMYNEGNIDELSRCMRTFLQMSSIERKHMGTIGRKHVENTMSWKMIAKQFLHQYEKIASQKKSMVRDWYMKYIDPRFAEYKDAFDAYLKGRSKILDVGCGIGNFIAFDAKHIEGVDQNIESIQIARSRGFRVKKGLVTKLPFVSNSFDGIFCGHVIEHLYPEDALTMLYEFDRVLKPSGRIVLKTPLMYGRFYNDLTHIRPYPPESIMDYLMFTTQTSTQRTADRKHKAQYKIVDLFYRYDFLYYPDLEPSRLGNKIEKVITSVLKVLSIILFRVGVQKYWVRNGYTIVLEKIG